MINPFERYVESFKRSNSETEFLKYKESFNSHRNIIVLGNGGSNAVASHISQDYVKFHRKNSLTFSDPSMLTCFINDYGMENAFTKFIDFYSTPETLVILMSSGGESLNIINCIKYCESNNIRYGLLTGFKPDNTARSIATNSLFNYHIYSTDYGVVECAHQIFLHGII